MFECGHVSSEIQILVVLRVVQVFRLASMADFASIDDTFFPIHDIGIVVSTMDCRVNSFILCNEKYTLIILQYERLASRDCLQI